MRVKTILNRKMLKIQSISKFFYFKAAVEKQQLNFESFQ